MVPLDDSLLTINLRILHSLAFEVRVRQPPRIFAFAIQPTIVECYLKVRHFFYYYLNRADFTNLAPNSATLQSYCFLHCLLREMVLGIHFLCQPNFELWLPQTQYLFIDFGLGSPNFKVKSIVSWVGYAAWCVFLHLRTTNPAHCCLKCDFC